MGDAILEPEVTVRENLITYRSRIRFKLMKATAPLETRLRELGGRQVIWDDADSEFAHLRPIVESAVCWPAADIGFAILELTFRGSTSEAMTVRMRHDLTVPAHIRVLQLSHGFAETIPRADWTCADRAFADSGDIRKL